MLTKNNYLNPVGGNISQFITAFYKVEKEVFDLAWKKIPVFDNVLRAFFKRESRNI